jgi:hypothetical protein
LIGIWKNTNSGKYEEIKHIINSGAKAETAAFHT